MKQASVDPARAANHVATQISVRMVHKDGRVGKFPGGPNIPGLMKLLDATVTGNWDVAAQVLRQYPTLLSAGDEIASVPLCLSTSLGQTEVVEFLIANGAAVNGAGELGMTPLHWAAVHNQPTIAKILLDAGADRFLQSWFVLTPANLAHANRHSEVLALLAPGNIDASKVTVDNILRAMGCISDE